MDDLTLKLTEALDKLTKANLSAENWKTHYYVKVSHAEAFCHEKEILSQEVKDLSIILN